MGDGLHGIKAEISYLPGIDGGLNQTAVKYIGDPGPSYSEHILRLMAKYNYLKDQLELDAGLGGSLNIFRANNRKSSAADSDPLEWAIWAGGDILWKPSEHFGIGAQLHFAFNILNGTYDVNAPFPYEFEDDLLTRVWPGLVIRTGTEDLHVDIGYAYGIALNTVDIPAPREGDPTTQAGFSSQHSVNVSVAYKFF
ncbi:MAG: hypothetical protein HYU97_12090 [Deltaproteobacteria bacterium]|nr:hypothetical protein [Deltaproteobacteria bacterium]